jgi:sulfate/thiosulfate transport system permease protein
MKSPLALNSSWKKPNVLPGFSLALGFTLIYLTLIVLIPLGAMVLKSSSIGPVEFMKIVNDSRVTHALYISFGTAFIAALVNVAFGVIVAWVLVRYRFPGKRIIDAVVDLPFALPTAVAGIALTALYAPNGWIGQMLKPLGIKIAFTPVGIVIALIFVGLPFIVRTVQPVMEEIDREVEEASATLGASRFQTISQVLLPGLAPAILTGFALAFARGVGEYGSVIFIAGNIPEVTEIAPLLIVIKLEEFNYAGATAIATIMLMISFAMLLVINLIQAWSRKRYGYGA